MKGQLEDLISTVGELEFRSTCRWLALVERGGDQALCDLCQTNKATDYHEIVHRSKSNRNSLTRMLSYRPELCSFLCSECHMSYHHREFNEELRNRLFQRNYELWRKPQVVAAWNELQRSMVEKLDWQLP